MLTLIMKKSDRTARCRGCKNLFIKEKPSSRVKFCSSKCFYEYVKRETIKRRNPCLVCGKKVRTSCSKFCGQKCFGIHSTFKKYINFSCKSCNKQFSLRYFVGTPKFCSFSCYIKFKQRNIDYENRSRKCMGCKKWKSLDEFWGHKNGTLNKMCVCKKCAAALSIKYNKIRRLTDPIFRVIGNFRAYFRKAFLSKGIRKQEATFSLLGFSAQDLYFHLKKYVGKKCLVCKERTISMGKNSVIDHIIPICIAKTKNGIIMLNQLKNLRLICSECNLKKGSIYEEHSYRRSS